MSGRAYVIDGYGFDPGKIETGKLVDFIKNHSETFVRTNWGQKYLEEILALKETEYDELNNILCEYECSCSGSTSMYSAISNIMSRETGVIFAYEIGDSEEAIMFESAFPWWLNDKEKNLTEKELHNIIWSYAEELGLKEKEIKYCYVSFWG